YVAGTRSGEVRLPVDSRRGGAEAVQVEDARCDPRPDVVDAGARLRRTEERGRDVAHVDEVAHLGSVSVDLGGLAAREAVEEDGDNAALERRTLARPVDVRRAERDVTRAVQAVPAGEVLLPGEL